MSSVVEKIIFLMESSGISGTALTSALGISSSSITEWKKGKAKPSVDAIVKIAQHFKVTTDYLLYDDVPPLRAPFHFTGEEVELVNRSRDMRSAGYEWRDISLALSLSQEAVKFADRWEALDDDGRYVVGAAIIQEERRGSADKKEARA